MCFVALAQMREGGFLYEYTVRDTFHFVSMLDNKNHRLIMASPDVDSLFTNIPTNIVTEKIFLGKRKIDGLCKWCGHGIPFGVGPGKCLLVPP